MRLSAVALTFTIVITTAAIISSADSPLPQDPIRAQLVPAEHLLQFREQIGLSDEQVKLIHDLANRTTWEIQTLNREVEQKVQALAKQLAATDVDESTTLQQLNALLTRENDIRRAQLRLMIKLKNLLSDDQQRVAKQLRNGNDSPQAIEQRLRSKLARVEKELRRRGQAGQPSQQAFQRLQKFHQLMQSGRAQRAESILDQLLSSLRIPKPAKVADDNGHSPVNPPHRHPAVAAPMRESEVAVRQDIDQLYVEDVAWRKIPWKTCLLDGLSASSKQHKPILLWVFIDRPIDDERC